MTTKNGNRRWAVFVCCGFGYVSATDDYKFVILFHDLPFLLGVHIFSVRDNSWKIVQVAGIHDDWIFSSKGVLSNEVLHWITENKTNELVISAFDLAEEEFHKESLLFPADVDCNIYDLDYNICNPWKRIELGCLDGCLCIHSLNTKAGGDIEVWVMREYRVLESWIKLFKFTVDDIPGVFVSQIPLFQFFVSESGTAFINSDFKELVRIECHKEEKPALSGRYKIEKWEPLNLGLWEQILESFQKEKEDAKFFSVMFYDETLVSVPE
ncbi:putative F-box associated interaction domain-containing protein [Rosa chinensis]|uniref:Putative F-box associated interaction domain-containing protein n=1 Tax=Rosa chinensis TaxID=74649 RepID=A0A2P6QLI8_ROSCH|nr:putative F-box associated interaction domain-containing protein [Rosa chinensis]